MSDAKPDGMGAPLGGAPTGGAICASPLCCDRRAWEALRRVLPELETPEGLVKAAVAVAMHHRGGAKPDAALDELEVIASDVRRRVRSRQPRALLAHLHEHLFEELGFGGGIDEGVADVHHASHSYLPDVLQRRRGLPILLALVYVTVARRLGLHAWGIGLPGHFLAGVECDGGRLIIDAYGKGRVLSVSDAAERLRELYGPEAEFSSDLLEPVSHRMWLTRIMQNLIRAFGSSGQFVDVGAMLELEMLLWPEQDRLQRDFGLVLARLGMTVPAGQWLSNYLRNNPDDPQREDLERFLCALLA
ncbi:MAG: SirB1 family protein [Tepidisphaerales bacterium]